MKFIFALAIALLALFSSKSGNANPAVAGPVAFAQLKQPIQRKYWSSGKGLYADTKEKSSFSQHANSLAILAGMLVWKGKLYELKAGGNRMVIEQ
jgi:hypothetical protein